MNYNEVNFKEGDKQMSEQDLIQQLMVLRSNIYMMKQEEIMISNQILGFQNALKEQDIEKSKCKGIDKEFVEPIEEEVKEERS